MGFMCTTAFLSMWISNTATAAMMLPIVHAVLVQIKKQTPEERSWNESSSNRRASTQLLSASYVKSCDGNSSSDSSVLEFANVKEDNVSCEADRNSRQTHITHAERNGKDARKGNSERKKPEEGAAKADNLIPTYESSYRLENIDGFTSAGASDLPTNGTFDHMTKVLMLGVVYSANIGGMATLTGTAPNLVLSGDVAT